MVSWRLYIAMIIASPTVTSAAATRILKIEKTCPVSSAGVIKREKATRAMLAAFNISSMHISITTALRLESEPYSPMEKRTADSTR